MFQHFLGYVRNENRLLSLKRLRDDPGSRNYGADLDCRRVCFPIELEYLQAVSLATENPEVHAVKATATGQNFTEAVQDSLYRRLLDHC